MSFIDVLSIICRGEMITLFYFLRNKKSKKINKNMNVNFETILKSMSTSDVLKELELYFMKHFTVSKPCGPWEYSTGIKPKQVLLKLRLILSWLSGVRVMDMSDECIFAYTITVMTKYRPFTLYMMHHGVLPYYCSRQNRFRFIKMKRKYLYMLRYWGPR